jgi:FtsP/CotA-like multicopper oxidase with cupredoxin domain
MTQEQSGIYGAFIIHKRSVPVLKEYPIVLSDWTDDDPEQVQRRLHNASDWYAIRKGSTQDYLQSVQKGYFRTKVVNEWKRMVAMDVSDVAYDRFLSNGKTEDRVSGLRAGDKIRLRVINGSSSSYFWLGYAGSKITVLANDGEDVQPVTVDRLIIAVAETYDIEVTVPQNESYELLATPEDRTKSTSVWLGPGTGHSARHLPGLQYFEGMKMMNGMMKANGDLTMNGMKMTNQVMDMNAVMYPEMNGGKAPDRKLKSATKTDMDMEGMDMGGMPADTSATAGLVTLNYGMLKSTRVTSLPAAPVKILRFDLTGNMNRYVWSINNKTVSEADKVMIRQGENVRIILYNNTMMRHPMHLHGHYFRLINGQGEYAPLKNTLDIMPMESDTIEFSPNASGDWFFHCHILYHMMSGMGRIFTYENSPPNPEIPDPVKALKKIYQEDRQFYAAARVGLESNGSDGSVSFAGTRWKVSTLWHLGLNQNKGYESETMAGRFFGQMQWLYAYGGFDYHFQKAGGAGANLFGQQSDKTDRHTVVAGLTYLMPMLVAADVRVDGNGKLRFQLGREDVPLTSRLRFAFMGNTDKEYAAGFRYIITKSFAASAHYDSDMGPGAGLTFNY